MILWFFFFSFPLTLGCTPPCTPLLTALGFGHGIWRQPTSSSNGIHIHNDQVRTGARAVEVFFFAHSVHKGAFFLVSHTFCPHIQKTQGATTLPNISWQPTPISQLSSRRAPRSVSRAPCLVLRVSCSVLHAPCSVLKSLRRCTVCTNVRCWHAVLTFCCAALGFMGRGAASLSRMPNFLLLGLAVAAVTIAPGSGGFHQQQNLV